MTVTEFAAMTQKVIALDGFDAFLPTACYPARQELLALEGLPPDVEPEPAVLQWAAKSAGPGELYLVAFKSAPSEFTVIRVKNGRKESATFEIGNP